MSVYTDLLPTTKSEKHGVFTWEPATDNAMTPEAGTLTISGKRSHTRYKVEEFVADHGRGFLLFKLDAGTDKTEEQYACFIGSDGRGQCECRGFYSTGHCKHLASLLALVEADRV